MDFNDVVPQCPTLFKDKENIPFLLSVAQHRKNKNLHLLIQSFANLLKNQKLEEAAELILVGSSGPETEALHQQVSTLNLQLRIRILASVSDQELCWLYKHCLLYIVASSTEGFCLPLAESLYFGCRVVCSDISILREVAANDCVYFNLEGNPVENLEGAILKVVDKPFRNPPDEDFRFSRATIADQYFKFYSRVMARSSP